MSPTRGQRARAARIAAELASLGFALPGTLADRHGPYHQWTRKIGGKTVIRILTDDQLADYQPWFDNQRKLRALVAELGTLSQVIADADPRWQR